MDRSKILAKLIIGFKLFCGRVGKFSQKKGYFFSINMYHFIKKVKSKKVDGPGRFVGVVNFTVAFVRLL